MHFTAWHSSRPRTRSGCPSAPNFYGCMPLAATGRHCCLLLLLLLSPPSPSQLLLLLLVLFKICM